MLDGGSIHWKHAFAGHPCSLVSPVLLPVPHHEVSPLPHAPATAISCFTLGLEATEPTTMDLNF